MSETAVKFWPWTGETFDNDGYPSESFLKWLSEVQPTTPGQVFDYFSEVVSAWHFGESWGRMLRPCRGKITVRLATGGWSGNEDIIRAVDGNFWGQIHKEEWKRGGLHIYRIKKP